MNTYPDDDWEDNEPIGSCDECGVNVYACDAHEDDLGLLCDQCAYMIAAAKAGE